MGESIRVRGSKPFDPRKGKSTLKSSFMRENEALGDQHRKYSSMVQKADAELMQMQRDDMADLIIAKQPKLAALQADARKESDLQRSMTEKKQRNLQRLVADQQKNKWYDQSKNKKYVPSFKTIEAANKEYHKQLEMLQNLSNILEKVRREHPETRAALQRHCEGVEQKIVGSTDEGKSVPSGGGDDGRGG